MHDGGVVPFWKVVRQSRDELTRCDIGIALARNDDSRTVEGRVVRYTKTTQGLEYSLRVQLAYSAEPKLTAKTNLLLNYEHPRDLMVKLKTLDILSLRNENRLDFDEQKPL